MQSFNNKIVLQLKVSYTCDLRKLYKRDGVAAEMPRGEKVENRESKRKDWALL